MTEPAGDGLSEWQVEAAAKAYSADYAAWTSGRINGRHTRAIRAALRAVLASPTAEPAGDVRALREAAERRLSEFSAMHDIDVFMAGVSAALASLDARSEQVQSVNDFFDAMRRGEDASMTLALVDPTETPSTVPQAPAEPVGIEKYREFAEEQTPKAQAGTWTLTAPDGRTWQADSPLRCVGAESKERVPAHVALGRIARSLEDEPAAPAEPVDVQRVYQRGVEAGKAATVPQALAQRWGSDALDVFYGAAADLRDGWPKLYAKALEVVTAPPNVNRKDSAPLSDAEIDAAAAKHAEFGRYQGQYVWWKFHTASSLHEFARSLLAAGAQREPLSDEQLDAIWQATYDSLPTAAISDVDARIALDRAFARAVLAASPVDPRPLYTVPLNTGDGDPTESPSSAVQRPAGGDEA